MLKRTQEAESGRKRQNNEKETEKHGHDRRHNKTARQGRQHHDGKKYKVTLKDRL